MQTEAVRIRSALDLLCLRPSSTPYSSLFLASSLGSVLRLPWDESVPWEGYIVGHGVRVLLGLKNMEWHILLESQTRECRGIRKSLATRACDLGSCRNLLVRGTHEAHGPDMWERGCVFCSAGAFGTAHGNGIRVPTDVEQPLQGLQGSAVVQLCVLQCLQTNCQDEILLLTTYLIGHHRLESDTMNGLLAQPAYRNKMSRTSRFLLMTLSSVFVNISTSCRLSCQC